MGGLTPNRCNGSEPVTLEHHTFTRHSIWKQGNYQPQPLIDITIWVDTDDYAISGRHLTRSPCTCRLIVVADIGCQSSLMRVRLLHHLGVNRSELISIRIFMKTINQKSINIMRVVLLHMLGQNSQGDTIKITQISYVTTQTTFTYQGIPLH